MKYLFIAFLYIFFISAQHATANPLNIYQHNKFVKGISYSSPFGKRKKIVLPDKTELLLNSNTTVWLDKNFGKLNRNVQISGDALFSIKKAKNIFIIYTPHLIITTSEAVARVNAYADVAGEETLLLSGKIKVVKAYYSKLDHDPYFLKDGDMVMMNKDIDLMEKETFKPGDLRIWINNKIVFHNSSLNDVIALAKSWFNVEVEVQGKVPSDLAYTGVFDGSDLQAMLGKLGKSWKFSYQAHQNTVKMKF